MTHVGEKRRFGITGGIRPGYSVAQFCRSQLNLSPNRFNLSRRCQHKYQKQRRNHKPTGQDDIAGPVIAPVYVILSRKYLQVILTCTEVSIVAMHGQVGVRLLRRLVDCQSLALGDIV